MLFNLLYCGGDEKIKLLILYDLVTRVPHKEPSIKKVDDERLLTNLEYFIMIPTLLLGNIIE